MSLAFTAATVLLISMGKVEVKAAEETSITYEKNIDIVKDYVIDSKDLATLAKSYNKTNKSSDWSQNNDINDDGIIDIYDLAIVSKYIGKNITLEDFSDYDFVEVGQKYSLPSNIRAKLGDKDFINLPIKWNEAINTSAPGKYTHIGTIDGYNKSLTFDLTVVPVNITANNNDLGFVTFDGDYIYYGIPFKAGLYKANIDGSNAQKLANDQAIYVNVLDEWVYYINVGTYDIYKVKTDGTDKTRVSIGYYYDMQIYNGKLYCLDITNKVFCSMNLDGTDKEIFINTEYPFSVNFVDNYVYYTNYRYYYPDYNNRFSDKIYKLNLDDASKTTLDVTYADSINVYGEYICYLNIPTSRIYRANIDGSNIVKLNNQAVSRIFLIGDWIYYIESKDLKSYNLGRIKTDGSIDEIVIYEHAEDVNFRAGRIYYCGRNGIFYTAKLDGTDIKQIN